MTFSSTKISTNVIKAAVFEITVLPCWEELNTDARRFLFKPDLLRSEQV